MKLITKNGKVNYWINYSFAYDLIIYLLFLL